MPCYNTYKRIKVNAVTREYLQYYTTVEQLLRQTEKAKASTNTDSVTLAQYNSFVAYVRDAIPSASRMIQRYIGTSFVPYKADKTYYFRDIRSNGRWRSSQGRLTLYLDDFLTVASGVTFNKTALSASDFREAPAPPYYRIEFNSQANLQWSGDFADGITVSGTWGYHPSIAQAYVSITADNAITVTDSATTITVADADAYETFQYIRIADEVLLITARDSNTNTLTVQRGANGTTATAHTNEQIEIFQLMTDIAMATTRLVNFMYENRVSYNIIQIGESTFTFDKLPNFVKDTLNYYQQEANFSLIV